MEKLSTLDIFYEINVSSIPNFHYVEPILYELCVTHGGAASLLISYMYLLKNTDSIKEGDIGKQAYWCSENIPSFGKLAKLLRNVRNKVEHKTFLSMELLQSLVKAANTFYERDTNTLTKIIKDTLMEVVSIIVNNCFPEKEDAVDFSSENDSSLYCPVCKRSGPIPQYPKAHEISKINTSPTIGVLFEFKSGIKDKSLLMDNTFRVLDGKFIGEVGRLIRWCGNNAEVELSTSGIKRMNLQRAVEIVPT